MIERRRGLLRASGARHGALGIIPEAAVVAALGLVIMALAMTSLRAGGPLPEFVSNILFWVALLLIALPAAGRLLDRDTPRIERLGLVLLVSEALYLVKIIRDPISFTRYDELLHWRTAVDIVSSGRLFEENPLLVVSPLFPGLESNTAAVMQLGGADVFVAGLIVIGIARAVLAVGLFLLYEEVGGSSWLAGLGAGLYMANPSFIFFSSIFVYESLALAVAVVVLLLTARRMRASGWALRATSIALVLAIAALVVTHHVTTLAVIGILALLAVAAFLTERGGLAARRATEVTVLAAAMALAWLAVVAQETFGYLGPPIINAGRQLIGLIAGEDVVRPLFTAESGDVAPFWERVSGLAATGIILAGIAVGVPLLWRRYRYQALALVFGALALAFPVLLIVRATRAGGSLAARSSSFVFIGVSFTVALAVVWMLSLDQVGLSVARRRLGMVALAGVLFVGSVVVGTPTWQRLPGPFLPGADSRSINEQSLAMADWAADELGPGHAFATDRTNRLVLGSYGDQRVVFAHGAGVATWAVFVTDELGPVEFRVLRRGEIEYAVIDRRLSLDTPPIGFYYERAEGARRDFDEPMSADQLDNFDEVEEASRVYDNGPIQVYDVSELAP